MPQFDLAVHAALIPAVSPLAPARSARTISTRFPRLAGSVIDPAGGETGLAGVTLAPRSSAGEAQAWGCAIDWWVYAEKGIGGYTRSQFAADMIAAGIQFGTASNTGALSDSLGPFQQSFDTTDEWLPMSAATQPKRPAPNDNASLGNDQYTRLWYGISYQPTGDAATIAGKIAGATADVAVGVSYLHVDDQRGGEAFLQQGADWNASAVAGFTTWLGANTTVSERASVGLPASLAGFNLRDHILANYASGANNVCYAVSPPTGVQTGFNNVGSQTDLSRPDTLVFRVCYPKVPALAQIIDGWYKRYLREAIFDQHRLVKAAAGVPMSCNFGYANPSQAICWPAYSSPTPWVGGSQPFDFGIGESVPTYWEETGISSGPTSSNFYDARMVHGGRNIMSARTSDAIGLRMFVDGKPTALNVAPAAAVVALGRQDDIQRIAWGQTPMARFDVFMTTNDALWPVYGQGVSVEGYRFNGNPDSYKDVLAFMAACSDVIDDAVTLPAVGIVASVDTYPERFGPSDTATNKGYTYAQRHAELIKADVAWCYVLCGKQSGLLPIDPATTYESVLPFLIRIQDDGDYSEYLARFQGRRAVGWSQAAVEHAANLSPARSSSSRVRISVRYIAAQRRVVIHAVNYALDGSYQPVEQTTRIQWSPLWPAPVSSARVRRLGQPEGAATFDSARGLSISALEWAIIDFTV